MAMEFNDRRYSKPFEHPGFTIDNTEAYRQRRAEYEAANPRGVLPSVKSLDDKYGAKLPGGLKPRTDKEWNARASVISAARAGSIRATERSPKNSKANGRIVEAGPLRVPRGKGK